MAPVYVEERQSEFWASRQIDEFLLNQGHHVRIHPLGQHSERHLPADYLFGIDSPVKLFGIQYKALLHNGTDGWKVPYSQYNTMGNFPWIYYGLSTLKDLSAPRNSLLALRMVQQKDIDPRRENIRERADHYYVDLWPHDYYYVHWHRFYQNLLSCWFGMLANNQEELKENIRSCVESLTLSNRAGKNIVDVFAFNLENGNTVKLSSQFREDEE